MFPIRDSVPKYLTPTVVYGLITVNALVFLFQQSLNPLQAVELSYHYGLVPQAYFEPDGALRAGIRPIDFLPFLTATFLHGGWLHIILNMWTLWIFGSTLESRMGAMPFLIFYLCCAVASTFVHGYFNAMSDVPVVGASGAIAGVIGAYAVRFPTARITLIVPVVIIPLIFSIPALAFAVIWFGIQLFQGTWDAFGPGGGGIAWWAHIGGFIAGVLLVPFFLLFAPVQPGADRVRPGPWDRR